MADVTLKNVSKSYVSGLRPAVDNVSLDIRHGEFMVLLGPSGCGKSTTLRMIAGLETITDGTLEIDHEVMNGVAAKDRDIAMVFQSYALYPHMSVRDNLAFGLRRRKVTTQEIDRRVDSVAATLGLSEYLSRRPHALSGGQRQRVALGRAIVREPKVFLFDEPLSNLDAALRVSTRLELARLHQRLGVTAIYVTHDQIEAMTLGTRVCVMFDGKVAQVGTPLDVYRNPANTSVAKFLGSPPMNLLECSVSRRSMRLGDVTVPLEGTTLPANRIVFGVRPEDVYVARPLAVGTPSVTMSTQVIGTESIGSETILIANIPETKQEITARAGRDFRARRGEMVDVIIDTSAARFFDTESRNAIPVTIGSDVTMQ